MEGSADKGDTCLSLIWLWTKIITCLTGSLFALSALSLGEHKADAGVIFQMWVMFSKSILMHSPQLGSTFSRRGQAGRQREPGRQPSQGFPQTHIRSLASVDTQRQGAVWTLSPAIDERDTKPLEKVYFSL